MKTGFHPLVAFLISAGAAFSTEPWPAEANTSAVKLTSIDAGLNTVNWSGAFWNPETRMLWLACNSGYFWALEEDGAGGFRVATNAAGTKAKWSPGGDLESLCQADFGQPLVYLMDEDNSIVEFDVSRYGVVTRNRSWNIAAQCPETGGLGPEGLAFVPDAWLRRQGFRRSDGTPYASTNGMGGLMFVGHQSGGYVHVFDLNRTNNGYGYAGRFKTGRGETAGLDFDRSTGLLWIWHNTGSNYLEAAELGSYPDGADRRLRPVIEYVGPRSGNLEGFALASAATNAWCFMTDDDNAGGEAVVWYRQFRPPQDADSDALPDAWERWHFQSVTQATGAADADLDGLSNADEYAADTQPTNSGSRLPPLTLRPSPAGFVLGFDPTSTGRLYTLERASNLTSAAWTTVTNRPGTGGAWTQEVRPSGKTLFFKGRVSVPDS